MNKGLFKTMLGILLGFVVFEMCVLFSLRFQNAFSSDYYKKTETSGTLEQTYTAMGPFETSTITVNSEDKKTGDIVIYYPKEESLKSPVVIVMNATGVTERKSQPYFRHLASWGFVVVGTQDETAYTGETADLARNTVLNENRDSSSVLYQRINEEKIGLIGLTQGAIGAVKAFEANPSYQAIFLASIPSVEMAEGRGWPYDLNKVNVPVFLCAGNGESDLGAICPLESMLANFETLNNNVKVMARKNACDNDTILAGSDGYMTAWFRWHLMEDDEARNVFAGSTPELFSNPLWTNVEIENAY